MKKFLYLFVFGFFSINCSSEPEIPVYTLSVTAGDGGTVSQTGGSFEEGTSVTITATPNSEYEFTGWSGGASGTDNPLTVVMTSDKTITASFAKKKYALTVDVVGQGTVNEQIISAGKSTDYNSGSLVRLTAVAATGWQFVSWSGISDSTDPIIEVLVSGPKTVTATFIRKQYDLTVNIVGQGDVTEQVINTGRTTQYEYQTKVELTAIAEDGWRFTGWSGAITGDINPVQVTVSDATEVTATFEREYPLTVNIVGEGEVTEEIVSTGRTTNYVEGKSVLLTAIPAAGWRFDGWTGAITSKENQIQLSITQAKEVTATFIQVYDLTLEIIGDGEVTEEIVNTARTTTYDTGKTVRLTAVPDAGWRFVGWTGDVESTTNPIDVVVTSSKSVTATFVQIYDLTVNIVGEGIVSEVIINPSRTTSYDSGITVSLAAVPATNWAFSGWTGDVTSTDLIIEILMSEAKEITATFISIDQDGDGVNDDIDECPDTPQGLPVDENGCIVTVQNINLNYNTLKMFPGKTIQLTAEVSPSNVLDDSISWTVEDNTIATVDENGLVTTITEGETNIVVSSNDGGSTKSIPILVGDWSDMISFTQVLQAVSIVNTNYTGRFGSKITNNSTQETIDLKGLKVYDGTGTFLYLNASETTQPDFFPNLAPGQSQTLTANFTVFVSVPLFVWTFSHNGEDITVVHKYGFEGNVVFGKGERTSRSEILNKTDLTGDIKQSN